MHHHRLPSPHRPRLGFALLLASLPALVALSACEPRVGEGNSEPRPPPPVRPTPDSSAPASPSGR